jgi:hypothetical protein
MRFGRGFKFRRLPDDSTSVVTFLMQSVPRLLYAVTRKNLKCATLILPALYLAGNGMGQQVLEDWSCSSATLTAGNPTTVTCSEPHNYTPGTRVAIWGATGASWSAINSQYNAYLRLNINAAVSTILVNDTLFFPQSGNFTVQIDAEQIVVNVANSDTLNVVTRGANGSSATSHALEGQIYGPLSNNVSYPITITSASTYTIPFNSSGYGAYSGNAITLQRSSFMYTSSPAPWSQVSVADGVGEVGGVASQSSHTWNIVIPGCSAGSYSNQSTAFECARGYTDPGNQKGYGGKAQASRLVISGGTGTLTLSVAYVYNGQEGGRTLGTNQLIWLEGFNEGSNAFNAINRPWIMSAVNGGLTQITIPNMGAAGAADGTYTPTGAAPWYGNNLWFQPPQSLYFYQYGDISNGAGYPSGYLQQMIKNGSTFNPLNNRWSIYACWGKNMTPSSAVTGNLEWGSYWAQHPSGASYHGYHSLNVQTFANQCGLYVFTSLPKHIVGQGTPGYMPNQPSQAGWVSSPSWTGESGYPYMQAEYHGYLNGSGLYSDYSGQTVRIGKMTMDYKPFEPEEYVVSRGAIYTGSAYEIDIQFPDAGVAGPTYEFRWSTSDMTTAGYSSGICRSGTVTCSSSDRITVVNDNSTEFIRYTSASLPAPSPTIYWAIRPTIPISGVSGSAQSPIWINTDYDPNMAVGDAVTISGLTGNTAANQSNVPITGLYPRTTWWFTNPSPSWPTGATSGNLRNIVCNGSTCTVNLTVSHGIRPGWRVMVWSTLTGDAPHGHRFTVASTPTASSFTFASNAAAGTYAADTASYHTAVQAEPGLSISGTGNGNWAGETGATLVSTENLRNFAEIAFSPTAQSVSTPPPTNSCDLNGDGVVNILDVNMAIGAVLGTGPCTARLDGSAQCTIVDVQRVATTALGGSCKVGQ